MIMPPGEILNDARAALKSGNYPLALENYQRFFDRALLDQGDGHNYYGVRLSYCLAEWFHLGENYPPARERLEAKAIEALADFEATGDCEKFHDFQSIRERLGQEDLVLSQFVQYHQSKSDLANSALRFMWNRLVEAKRWDICSTYLTDFESKYEQALSKFDQAMKICQADPSLGGDKFAEQIRGWYVRDVGNLLAALKHSAQQDGAAWLVSSVASDMQSRGFSELVSHVVERAVL